MNTSESYIGPSRSPGPLHPLSYVTEALRWKESKFQSLKAKAAGQGPRVHMHAKYFLENYK